MGKKKNSKPFWKRLNFKDERWTKVLGLFTLFFSILLLISMISYLFTWRFDQDKVLNFSWHIFFQKDLEVANTFGRLGAFLSHQVMYWSFGLPAFVLVYISLMYTWKWVRNAKYSLAMKTLSALWIMVYSSVLLESLLGRFAFPFGGAIGEWIAFYLRNMLGMVGLIGLLLLIVAVIFIWNFNPDFSGLRMPSYQLSGGESPSINMGSFLSFFKKNQSDQPSGTVSDGTNGSNKKPIDMDFTDEVPDLRDDREPITLDQDHYKPQYADLKDLRKNEPVLEFEEININTPGTRTDAEALLDLEIHHLSEDPEMSLDPLSPNIEDLTLTEDHYANLQPYDPDAELSKFQLPSVELLHDYTDQNFEVDRAELEANKDQIIETLMHYKIEITKIRATVGPTVTLYEIIPAPGVRISKIKNLEDDIALNLSALGIRIIAPIPGKGTIGIEVPNKKKQIVSLKEVLMSDKFQQSKMDLPIALGRTISNEVFVADLAKMPHLLIAGATGQGKSVGINTILMSLLYKKHPAQVKLVLIDPKKVELFPYSKLENHFLAYLPDQDEPIVTETNKVIFTLNSLCIEMDNRYDLLKKAESRNIKEYNKKFTARQLNPEKGHKFLPFIILVIDEFADMIMTAGKEVELPIGRLAQLARAVGIHLIIATQRPSVNIITGVIKANFPARLAFKVSSKVDSRTILDTGGADQLIGSGDMLLSVGGDMIRLQCAFVDTPEVENVLKFIHDQRGFSTPYFLPEYTGEEGASGAEKAVLEDLDDMLDEAGRLVVQNQHGSTSMIQRRLKLGYNRAGRIMDQLELLGIVGAGEGSKPREVLVSTEAELGRILDRIRGGKEKDTLF
ncbi:MAG: DNA translocase FtsK [Saprospiraceae bacterium]|jgi:S-DNA-T family DNA segregation ATPase FtsK/SpoIIIE|nr:DNA translocase FtsK [Saprospiraceae bacterium]MBK6480162.1 DNA translocase FtsK [Saprospiraceae bacterium]MBK8511120.1 DNA translocase FtsK [Saprospiraceae bacterium]MBK9930010.1 DNA translocase FtsK [Saprospiraceae bacterium]MBP7803720.1 DNA translocase FtsK [Saprospiraceae bacterium]